MVDSQEALMHTYLNLSPIHHHHHQQPGNPSMSESPMLRDTETPTAPSSSFNNNQNTSSAFVSSYRATSSSTPIEMEMEASRLAEQRHMLMGGQPPATASANEMNIVAWMQGVDFRLMQIENCINSLVQQTTMAQTPAIASGGSASAAASQIRRRDLETVLAPLFRLHPSPTTLELSSVTRTLEHLYPQLERRPILSQVRKWFRKRREELGQKVFAQSQARWGNQSMDKAQVDLLLAELRRDRQVLTQILEGCAMDLEVNEDCLNMVHLKVESYLTRRKSINGKSQLDSDDD